MADRNFIYIAECSDGSWYTGWTTDLQRRIRVQNIDLCRYGMSNGEFESVLRAVGGVDKLIDWEKKSPEIDLMRYMDDRIAKEDKLFDHPELMKTPVVRNGKLATVGYCPEVWKQWEQA